MLAKLIFPVGVPGSGKSTWAKTMFGGKYAIVSSDTVRKQKWGSLREAHDVTPEVKEERNEYVWNQFYKKLDQLLSNKVDCYADATNLTSRARNRLRATAEKHGAELHVILFDNVVEALQRNVERDHDAIVPDDVQEKFVRGFADSYQEVLRGQEQGWYNSVTIIGSLR